MNWNPEAFTAAGLEFRRSEDGRTAFFKTPPTPMDEVAVGMADEVLKFIPQRSSGHKRVMARLGIA